MPIEDMQGAEPATFALNASQSSVVELAPYKLVAIEVPPGFTGTTLTLLASYRAAGPFYPVYTDAGDEVTITVAASTVVGVDAAAGALAALRFIKFRSGTAASPVTQDAAVTLILHASS